MMCSRGVLVDLPEDGRRMSDHIRVPAKQPAWAAPYGLGKGQFRSRKNANCCVGIFRRSESASAGIEVVGGQFVANLGGTRLYIVQAVIAHAEDSSVVASPNRQKATIAPGGLMLPTALLSGHGRVVK